MQDFSPKVLEAVSLDSSAFPVVTAILMLSLLLLLVLGLLIPGILFLSSMKVKDRRGITNQDEGEAASTLPSSTQADVRKLTAEIIEGQRKTVVSEAQLDELKQQYEEQRLISTLKREERYSKGLRTTIANIYETIKKFGGLADSAQYAATNMRADRVDPYIAGGMAEGLAGPAAGMAAFVEANAQNERAERELPGLRRHYAVMSTAERFIVNKYQKYLPIYQSKLELLSQMSFREVSPDTIDLRLLKLERVARIMIEATIEVTVKQDAMSIEGNTAIVDGSFLVTLKEGTMVAGKGYLNGQYDESLVAPSVTGFGIKKGRSTHSVLIQVGYIRNLNKIDVEVKPLYFWRATVPGGSIDIPAPPKNAVDGPA